MLIILSVVSPFILKVWKGCSQFLNDHSEIRAEFAGMRKEISEIKEGFSDIQKELHSLNQSFRDYSEATDTRLSLLEQNVYQNGNGHHE